MKALSKPISSPGRAENFPPPLMTFLRSNAGSRSRGRSRSSPLFYIRSKRNAAGVIETTQEPSSPKVTCIGQVKSKAGGGDSAKRRRCWLLKKTLLFGKILSSQERAFRRILRKWGLFLRSGYCKKVDATEDSFRAYSDHKSEKSEKNELCSKKYKNFGGGDQERKRDFFDDSCSSFSPPKNALILTRCRSAPYRSSSLGGRFWGSPLAENEAKKLQENPRISQENSGNNVQDLEGIAVAGSAVLQLTRCKSEPARTGERLNPEANFSAT